MQIGVSIYPDFLSFDELKSALDRAKRNHIKLLFTSIQLDNLNFEGVSFSWEKFQYMFNFCKENSIKVTIDVNDIAIKKFSVNKFNELENIKNHGIHALRIDGGFTHDQIAEFTTNVDNIKIEINASMTRNLDTLLETISLKGNLNNLIACHNFFPRKYTGLGWDRFDKYNRILRKYKIKIGAFLSSQNSRGLLCKTSIGCPTIELHRSIDIKYQVEDFKVRDIDYAIISETEYSDYEVDTAMKAASEESINFYLDRIDPDILEMIFTLRADQPENLRRMDERLGKTPPVAYSKNIVSTGSVTRDNDLNGRYAGEIQIVLKDMKYEKYVNVIGMISIHQLDLLKRERLLLKKITFK